MIDSTGSDAFMRINDAIARIISQSYSDVIQRISDAQMRIGAVLRAK